jgi:hypothetical protein
LAREFFVVSAFGSGWAIERDGAFVTHTPGREQALLLARSAAHRAFQNGSRSAVMVRGADNTLCVEWQFGFEDALPG